MRKQILNKTIDNGIKILEEEINNTQNNLFSGEIAFKII